MKFGFLKSVLKARTSLEPSGSSATNKMSMVWWFATRQDLWQKGFAQVEGLDFGETFAPVARLEAIRILLAYASHHNIKLFQMDVKSAFLNVS